MKTVELHAAFFYDCDNCGREVFVKGDVVPLDAILRSLPKKDREVARKFLSDGSGFTTITPQTVVCPHPDCNASFLVASLDDMEEDSEDDMS